MQGLYYAEKHHSSIGKTMKKLYFREGVDQSYRQLAAWLYDNPKKTLLGFLLVISLFISQIPNIRLDSSSEGLLHPDDPILVSYNNFRHQFGQDEGIQLLIHPPEVFDPIFLNRLKEFHEELAQKVPHVVEVTSLLNVRETVGEEGALKVRELGTPIPTSPEAMAQFKKTVLEKSLYHNNIISEDGRYTTILIKTSAFRESEEDDPFSGFDETASSDIQAELLTDEDNKAIATTITSLVDAYQKDNFQVSVAGAPILTYSLNTIMENDIQLFLVVSLGLIGGLLFVLFRTIVGVVLPFIVIIGSLLITIGTMAFFGVPITLPTQILPSFLIVVGVGYTIHLLALYYRDLKSGLHKREAMINALEHSGLPILMTSLTTAGGLLSLSVADIKPIGDLGMFASYGVLVAFVLSVVALLPFAGIVRQVEKPWADVVLQRIAGWVGKYHIPILLITVVIAGGSLLLAEKLKFSHNPLVWLPESMPIARDTQLMEKALQGSMNFEILIDTGKPNGIINMDILNRTEQVMAQLKELKDGDIFVGKVSGLPDLVKEINQALNQNDPAAYRLPKTKALLAQELLLFENSGSEDLNQVVDGHYQTLRLTLRVPWRDAIEYSHFFERVQTLVYEAYEGVAEVQITGMFTILFRTVSAVIVSMAKSYLLAAVIISLLMMALLSSVKLGLISMIPNFLPILLSLGLMKLLNIPLDLSTIMVASVVIGLAVDDTIHFMHNFRRYYFETYNVEVAVHRTLQTTGRALLFTSIVLMGGFLVFTQANMKNVQYFGLLTAFTAFMALCADVIVAPAIMFFLQRFPQILPKEPVNQEDK